MLKFSDSRNFGRTMAVISLVATPIVLLIGVLVSPDTSDDAAKALADISDNEAGYVIGGLMFLIAPIVFVPGMMGTIRLMRRQGVTIGQIGAALIMIGALITVSFYGYGVIEYVAATDAGLDRVQMAKLVDAAEDTALNVPILVAFLLGLVLGSVLLAIGLWRSGVVPRWSPVALVVSTVLGFFAESVVLSAISFVLLFVALVAVAQKIHSISDEEWEDWRLPERAPPAAPPAQGTCHKRKRVVCWRGFARTGVVLRTGGAAWADGRVRGVHRGSSRLAQRGANTPAPSPCAPTTGCRQTRRESRSGLPSRTTATSSAPAA